MIYVGDLFEVLPKLAANSLDACCTDPPYELRFMGRKWDSSGVAFQTDTWEAVLRVLKPGAHLLAAGIGRTHHRMMVAVEDAGFEIRDCLYHLFGTGFPKSLNLGNGLGTALKPGAEIWVLARKPMVGAVAHNVQTHGTGALNIDACRIEGVKQIPASPSRTNHIYGDLSKCDGTSSGFDATIGRWPANVVLSHTPACREVGESWACVPDCPVRMLDEQAGELTSNSGDLAKYPGAVDPTVFQAYAARSDKGRSDAGGASRFFYCAKPDRAERDHGCEALPQHTAAELTGRKPGSAGLQNPRAGIRAGSMDRDVAARVARNLHPTVKPLDLMRWLVRLVVPPNGTCLDPFMGSGTTGMACRAELREFVGIEQDATYAAIAERRLSAVAPLFFEAEVATTVGEPRQVDLFAE